MIELSHGYDIAVMEIDGFAHPLSAVCRRDTRPRNLNTPDDYRPALADAELS